MKNKITLAIICLISILAISNLSYACMSFPIVETKNNVSIYLDYDNYRNETAILNLLNSKKIIANLTNEEMFVLKNFLVNGYSVKEQTNEEYALFLEEVKVQNAKPGCVLHYKAVYHDNRWTGYITGSDSVQYDENGDVCPAPTYKCGVGYFNIIWNDLTKENTKTNMYYIIISILAVVIVAILFKNYRK